MTRERTHHVRGRREINTRNKKVAGRRGRREERNLETPETPSLESFLELSEDEVEVELHPLTKGGGHMSELIIEHNLGHQSSDNSWVNPIFQPRT
jgi:hypothetical protein